MDSRYWHHRSWNPYEHSSPLLLASSTATEVFSAPLPERENAKNKLSDSPELAHDGTACLFWAE